MSAEGVARIRERLQRALAVVQLEVFDEDLLHAGHAAGGGHYRVRVVARDFEGQSAVARHRMVYAALGEVMPAEVHALGIEALAPSELGAGVGG